MRDIVLALTAALVLVLLAIGCAHLTGCSEEEMRPFDGGVDEAHAPIVDEVPCIGYTTAVEVVYEPSDLGPEYHDVVLVSVAWADLDCWVCIDHQGSQICGRMGLAKWDRARVATRANGPVEDDWLVECFAVPAPDSCFTIVGSPEE